MYNFVCQSSGLWSALRPGLLSASVGMLSPRPVSVTSVGCTMGLLWDPLHPIRSGTCRGLTGYDCTETYTLRIQGLPLDHPWGCWGQQAVSWQGPVQDDSAENLGLPGPVLFYRYCLQVLWPGPDSPADHSGQAASWVNSCFSVRMQWSHCECSL